MGVTVRQKLKGKGKPSWVFVSHNGKRKSKMIGDKKAAEKVASAIRERLFKGELNLDDDRSVVPTFVEYSKKWVEGYIKSMRRLSTFERYQEMLENCILQLLKNNPLDKITQGDLDFNSRYVWVRQSYRRGQFIPPKERKGPQG